MTEYELAQAVVAHKAFAAFDWEGTLWEHVSETGDRTYHTPASPMEVHRLTTRRYAPVIRARLAMGPLMAMAAQLRGARQAVEVLSDAVGRTVGTDVGDLCLALAAAVVAVDVDDLTDDE